MPQTPSNANDHPIRAMLLQGKHPFPADIEAMLRRLQTKPGAITTELAMDAFDWERGERLGHRPQEAGPRCATPTGSRIGVERCIFLIWSGGIPLPVGNLLVPG